MVRNGPIVLAAILWVLGVAGASGAAGDERLDELVGQLAREVRGDSLGKTFSIASEIAQLKDPAAIPPLIGIIDADNSYKTIYGVGYYGLRDLTGVSYDEVHHGPWWRKWWLANRARFPKEVQDLEIPTFPQTEAGREFAANPPDPASVVLEPGADDYLARVEAAVRSAEHGAMSTPCRRLGELGDEHAIPKLIGLMDADNSPAAVSEIGSSALAPLTGVRFHPSRHGKWWRAWWQANRGNFPESVREIAIPDYPMTEHGREFARRIEGARIVLEPTLDDLLELITGEVAAESSSVSMTAMWIAEYENPRAIEPLVELIARDESGRLKYDIGYFALGKLTEVSYDESHDARWWTDWWREHKDEIRGRIDRAAEPPSGDLYLPNHLRPLVEADDVSDIPSTDTRIGEDERKRYVLIGPKKDAKPPAEGWRLLLVMPGGPGSPDFHPFVKRITKNVLSSEYLVAHVIAPEWTRRQARNLVWPTRTNPWQTMEFSTEELVDAVIADVASRYPVDGRYVFTLSWSSSGPAAYAVSLEEKTRVTGSLVAMSIFRPESLPPLSRARGHAYFILHSPQDFIKIDMAREAERTLREHGARVRFQTYEGGHGWRDDPFGKMRMGIEWLERQSD